MMPNNLHAATANPNAKRFTLSQREQRELPGKVLEILKHHIGAENAITGIQVARQCGYREDRKVRAAIRELLHQGHPVLSSVCRIPGYFLPRSQEEAEESLVVTRARAI